MVSNHARQQQREKAKDDDDIQIGYSMTDPMLNPQFHTSMVGSGGCVAAAIGLLGAGKWLWQSGLGEEMLLLFAISGVEIGDTKIRERGLVTGSVLGHRDLLWRGVEVNLVLNYQRLEKL